MSLVDINRSSQPAPGGPPIHRAARNGFFPAAGLWTAESVVRQRAIRAAVLIEAIRCLVGAARMRERPARQSARRWILSRDTNTPYSFNNVCEALCLDPSRLRRSLLNPVFGANDVPRIALSQA